MKTVRLLNPARRKRVTRLGGKEDCAGLQIRSMKTVRLLNPARRKRGLLWIEDSCNETVRLLNPARRKRVSAGLRALKMWQGRVIGA
jgi:hypothetical protein